MSTKKKTSSIYKVVSAAADSKTKRESAREQAKELQERIQEDIEEHGKKSKYYRKGKVTPAKGIEYREIGVKYKKKKPQGEVYEKTQRMYREWIKNNAANFNRLANKYGARPLIKNTAGSASVQYFPYCGPNGVVHARVTGWKGHPENKAKADAYTEKLESEGASRKRDYVPRSDAKKTKAGVEKFEEPLATSTKKRKKRSTSAVKEKKERKSSAKKKSSKKSSKEESRTAAVKARKQEEEEEIEETIEEEPVEEEEVEKPKKKKKSSAKNKREAATFEVETDIEDIDGHSQIVAITNNDEIPTDKMRNSEIAEWYALLWVQARNVKKGKKKIDIIEERPEAWLDWAIRTVREAYGIETEYDFDSDEYTDFLPGLVKLHSQEGAKKFLVNTVFPKVIDEEGNEKPAYVRFATTRDLEEEE